ISRLPLGGWPIVFRTNGGSSNRLDLSARPIVECGAKSRFHGAEPLLEGFPGIDPFRVDRPTDLLGARRPHIALCLMELEAGFVEGEADEVEERADFRLRI